MSPRRPRSSRLLATLTLGLVLAGVVALSEGLLRIGGYAAWTSVRLPPNEPVLYEPDPVLGWRAKGGVHVFSGYVPGSDAITMTVLEDGSRSTGFPGDSVAPELALMGGSFVQGWGLSDDETLGWKLQQRHASLRVTNHGMGGWGTYQSLLRLEVLMARPEPPRLVLYGFVALHEARNVADPEWLFSLALAAREGIAAVPFASLDDQGGLVRHPAQAYPRWPLREQLALVAFAEERWNQALGSGRADQRRSVTHRLIRKMDEVCAAHGTKFGVVFLSAPAAEREQYAQFLRRRGISFIDCSRAITPELMIPGEGHPNGKLNSIWAECISEHVPLADLVG